jgi:membrane protein implicated in regulation of membrane protease activity
MFESILNNPEYWHWWSLGILFLILEIFAPGFILVWFGAAAFVVGASLLILDLDTNTQLLIWSIVSIASILVWHKWRKANPPQEDGANTLNKRGHDFIGRRFTLDSDIINGFGKIKVDDSIWKVEVDLDLKIGDKIVITGIDGTVLKAEKSE